MRRKRIVRVFMLLPIGLAAVVVFGLVVMGLWNALLPQLLGVKAIGFWQALGVLLLCRILFGGFGGGGHRGRRRDKELRWERMTPEERERMREFLRARWGHAEPASKPSE